MEGGTTVKAEREPQPERTKRGRGAGAKLDLAINYYKSPDGIGPDYGVFFGRDEAGPWELHFANDKERDKRIEQMLSALEAVATEAREHAEERDTGTTVWLKAIGAVGWPAQEIWWQDDRSRDECIRFPYRPQSIHPGDLMVIYASGTGKIVGVVRAKGPWYHEGAEERWPYRIDTEIIVARPISEGVALESISDEREITKSIRQKSHIRLSQTEAATALSEFGVPDQG
jgi:EVE domain